MSLLQRIIGPRPKAVAAQAAAPRMEPALSRSSVRASGAIDNPTTFFDLFSQRGWNTGGTSRVQSLPPVSPDLAQRHATVFACCNTIAGDESKLPLVVMEENRRGNFVPVSQHPANYLLNVEAAPGVPSMVARFALTYAFCLRGNSFAFAPRDAAGELMMIESLLPDAVAVQRAGRARFYDFTDGEDRARRAPSRTMIHLRYMALDGWTGRSPISVAAESVGLALAGQEAAARAASGTQARAYVRMDDAYEDDEAWSRNAERIRTALNDEQARMVPVIPNGDIKSLDMSAADQQLLESRKFDREQIAALYRVPPFKLGILEHGVKANGQQQAIDYRADCLSVWCGLVAAQAGLTLLTEDERRRGLYLAHDYSELLTPTTRELYESIAVAVGGPFMHWTEGRERANLGPIAEGLQPYPPANMTRSEDAPQ